MCLRGTLEISEFKSVLSREDIMSKEWNGTKRILRPLIHNLMRHRRQKTASGAGPTVAHSKSTSTPLMFETLEPRLLLAADLIAGYNFNEASGTSAADASGHNIIGTLVNGPTHTTGQYGNAVGLDGINDYVNL